MKKIDKFSDYPFRFTRFGDILIDNIDFLFPKPLLILFFVILFIISLFKKEAFVILVPLVSLYAYQYFSLKKNSRYLKIKRSFPKQTKEENQEDVLFRIKNPVAFSLANFTLVSEFTLFKNPKGEKFIHFYLDDIKNNTVFGKKVGVQANTGMGIKEFGPDTYEMTDATGIHKLTLTSNKIINIKVFPKVYPTKLPKNISSKNSINFGQFDSTMRGNNVNFYGTKEYQPGDQVKHINWKLSLKSQKTIVNLFEQNTNSEISLLLVNDQRLHFGADATSTLEYCKDLLLSFCKQSAYSNNSLAVFTNDGVIKLNKGAQFLAHLEIEIMQLTPQKYSSNELHHSKIIRLTEVDHLYKKIILNQAQSNQIYIFTSMIRGKVWSCYFEMFLKLKRRFQKIHLIIPYGLEQVNLEIQREDALVVASHQKEMQKDLENLKFLCRRHGIQLSLVKIGHHNKYKETIKDGFKRC
ncbi:MAG: DUF58 domain-containing protein [Halobacteriovoraceae bacterium]|jgi:uncharacterized protein (DUF58 family)|nr:DUF58 domain-containing protein [Halobacteriovoraceae bacterium]